MHGGLAVVGDEDTIRIEVPACEEDKVDENAVLNLVLFHLLLFY